MFVVLNIQELLGDGDKTFILLFPVSIFPSFIQVTFRVLLLPFSEHTDAFYEESLDKMLRWWVLRGTLP